MKGGSSKWIHETFPEHRLFAWQEEYGAFSVSVSQLDKTIEYIKGQEAHHRKMTFQEEFLVPHCGIEKTSHRIRRTVFVEMSFSRPCGTYMAWCFPPALKRRAIFGLSRWDKAKTGKSERARIQAGGGDLKSVNP
jgi:hypothetical protein